MTAATLGDGMGHRDCREQLVHVTPDDGLDAQHGLIDRRGGHVPGDRVGDRERQHEDQDGSDRDHGTARARRSPSGPSGDECHG